MEKEPVLGCGHAAAKAGELNGVSLCYLCASKMAEETAYRAEDEPISFTRLEWFVIGICLGFALCVAAVAVGGWWV